MTSKPGFFKDWTDVFMCSLWAVLVGIAIWLIVK